MAGCPRVHLLPNASTEQCIVTGIYLSIFSAITLSLQCAQTFLCPYTRNVVDKVL